MGSSYYITYGGNRLTFPGVTGSVAWEAPVARTFWVTSDNPNVYVTGTVYDSAGNAITSLAANGNSASAKVSTAAVSARMTASAADYYATLFNGDGGSGFTQDWTRNGRYGSGTVQYSGDSLVLGSHSGQTNNFTASGDFASDVTARYGWSVPARILYLSKAVGTYGGDVSANKSYAMDIQVNVNSWGSYPVTQNGIYGTFSAASGWIKETGNSYRRVSYGNFGYWMRGRSGPVDLWDGNYGNGSYNKNQWADTVKTGTWSYAGAYTWGTAIDGSNRTINVAAQYGNTGIYTNAHGQWLMSGIAK